MVGQGRKRASLPKRQGCNQRAGNADQEAGATEELLPRRNSRGALRQYAARKTRRPDLDKGRRGLVAARFRESAARRE